MKLNTICITFRQKNKNLNFWTFEFLKKPLKNLGFFRSHFPALSAFHDDDDDDDDDDDVMIDVMQRMKKKSTFPRTAPPPLPWQPDRQIKKEGDYIQLVPSDRESAVTTNATAVKVAPKAYSEKGLSPPPCTSRPLPLLPYKQPKKEKEGDIPLVHSDIEGAKPKNSTSITGAIAGQSKALSDKELSKQPSRTPVQKTDGASSSPDAKSTPGKGFPAFPYVYSLVFLMLFKL